jgi:hypothetical protein
MRKTPENFCIVLDSLVHDPNVTLACKKVGIQTMTLYRWLKLSRDGAAEFQNLEWSGEVGSFHQFFEYAVRAQINEIEQTAKSHALGFDEVVTFQGSVQYKIDPKLVGESDDPDTLEMLWGVRDKFLRIDGEVQPLTVRRKPSDALVIKMLSSHKPEIYGDKSTVNVNMKVGGVLRLQRPGEMPVKTLEQQNDGSFGLDDTGAVDEVDTTTMLALGRAATSSEEFEEWTAAGEFAAAPVKIAPPVAAHDDPTNPITKDTLARMAARANNPAAPVAPLPLPVEMRADPDADLDDVTGTAMKTVPPDAHTIEALIDSIKNSMAAGTRLGAREKQIADRLAAGDTAGAETLARAMLPGGRMAEQDHLGAGQPSGPKGQRVV